MHYAEFAEDEVGLFHFLSIHHGRSFAFRGSAAVHPRSCLADMFFFAHTDSGSPLRHSRVRSQQVEGHWCQSRQARKGMLEFHMELHWLQSLTVSLARRANNMPKTISPKNSLLQKADIPFTYNTLAYSSSHMIITMILHEHKY